MSPALRISRDDDADADNPLNRMLDALDAMVEAICSNGLEPQLRRRLEALLPPLPLPERDLFTAPAPVGSIGELELSILIKDCAYSERAGKSEIARQTAGRMRATAQAQLDALVKGRAA